MVSLQRHTPPQARLGARVPGAQAGIEARASLRLHVALYRKVEESARSADRARDLRGITVWIAGLSPIQLVEAKRIEPWAS
jgi:hypothetical protein